MARIIHTTGLNQKIVALEKDELDYLEGLRGLTFELVEEAGIEMDEDAGILDMCDELIRAWHQSDSSTRTDANLLVTACGVILGDHLSIEFKLDWAICDDKDGVELCLFRKENEVLLFPTHSVAKHFSAATEGCVCNLYDQLSNSLRNLK